MAQLQPRRWCSANLCWNLNGPRDQAHHHLLSTGSNSLPLCRAGRPHGLPSIYDVARAHFGTPKPLQLESDRWCESFSLYEAGPSAFTNAHDSFAHELLDHLWHRCLGTPWETVGCSLHH